MIDIVNFQGEKFNLGFSKVYHVSEFNIKSGDVRTLVNNKNLDILVSSEKIIEKDSLHYRNSGLNQVTCKIAKQNKIAIAFSFNDILKNNDKAKLLGRMMLNVKLCRKYKVNMVIASFANNKYEMRSSHDLLSFAQVIGMTALEAKQSLNFKKKEDDIKLIK